MATPVVTVATGGVAVVETVSGGLPVTEAINARGIAVTKVVGKPGLPVIFVNETGGPVAPPVLATFDGVSSGVTLSNGNLTAVYVNGGSSGARSTALKSSGKYYFEYTIGAFNTSSSNGSKAGVLLSTGTYLDLIANGTNAALVVLWSGNVWSNNVSTGKSLGACNITGNVIGCAIDLDARKAWFCKNGGNWNGEVIGLQNPATGIGGAVIAGGSFSPAVGLNWAPGDTVSANFGQAAFAFSAPGGFGSWSS